jgi:hypothetical protein
MWACPLLETVFFAPEPKPDREPAPGKAGGFNVRGDLEMIVFVAGELRRSYAELPLRWLSRRDFAREDQTRDEK